MSLLMTATFNGIHIRRNDRLLKISRAWVAKVLEIYNCTSQGTHSGGAVATSHISNADGKIIERKQIKTYRASFNE